MTAWKEVWPVACLLPLLGGGGPRHRVLPEMRCCHQNGPWCRGRHRQNASSKSRQRLESLNRRDRVVGAATFVLLISFWLPWYSIGPFSIDGPSAHGWLFIAVMGSIVLVLYVLIIAFGVGDLAEQGRCRKISFSR